MLNQERYYLVPKKREPARWIHPHEFSPEDVRLIKILIYIGFQHLKENKESCPWPEKANDILKEIERLNTCVPYKVLLTTEEYEALYALLTLAVHLIEQPAYRSSYYVFELDNKEKGNVSALLQKVTENMERLREQETLGARN